jgi:hypothetical protein
MIAFASLCIGLSASAHSQGGLDGYPFDVPADSRSFAMGESFSALPANPSALIFNPAGLAGLTGLRVSYSQRSLATNNEQTLRSFNAAIGTPIGTFAAQYNRDSYIFPTVVSGEGGQPVMDSYDYDIAMGYAVGLGRGFSAGVAAKYYDEEGTASTFPTMPAGLFDVGFTYTFRRFHSQVTVEDSITIGMSYQNIGHTWSRFYTGANITELYYRGIPQYLRAGLSYALRVVPRREGEVSPLQAVVSAEYRSGPSAGWPDVGGIGMECTIEEFISVRTGAVFMDGDNDTHFRYGLGLRLPFRGLGVDLLVHYAVIPWYSFSALSIDIQTSGGLL